MKNKYIKKKKYICRACKSMQKYAKIQKKKKMLKYADIWI